MEKHLITLSTFYLNIFSFSPANPWANQSTHFSRQIETFVDQLVCLKAIELLCLELLHIRTLTQRTYVILFIFSFSFFNYGSTSMAWRAAVLQKRLMFAEPVRRKHKPATAHNIPDDLLLRVAFIKDVFSWHHAAENLLFGKTN